MLLHLYRTIYKFHMEERLKLFLAMEGLSPSQFADKLGVQRSGVSHLLSGRNKPSFEFISKMLVTFPKINPDWLITGVGKAYRDFPTDAASTLAEGGSEPNVSLQEDDAITGEPELFSSSSSSDISQKQQQIVQPLSEKSGDQPSEPTSAQSFDGHFQSPVSQPVVQQSQPKYPSENRTKSQPVQPVQPAPSKRIAQITILYTDGTFEVR